MRLGDPSLPSSMTCVLMLPSATSNTAPIRELLTDPRVGCTSLNLSYLPDGRFRGTIMRADGREWIKGYGATPEAALEHVRTQV